MTILAHNWTNAWRVSRQVLDSRKARLRLALRLNPMFVMAYWLFWSVSMIIGIQMFIRDKGLVWERTEKVDANHDLVRELELTAVGGVTQTAQTRAVPGPLVVQPSVAQSVPAQSVRARSGRPLHHGQGRHRKPRSLGGREPIISEARPRPARPELGRWTRCDERPA